MSKLIPRREGQKLTYKSMEKLPEKIELINGNFSFTENEKKALLLALHTNTGLEFLINVLPEQSLLALKNLICATNETKNDKSVEKMVKRVSKVGVPEISLSPHTERLMKQNQDVIEFLQGLKGKRFL
ncbi:type II toxin-antitoxin system SpoIISB family antitoxin [Geobacillus sp. TFV-3]|uniref:type II toxin-antitoxin system SpoIISB family antitoxin n=1 Tax=Geobacillus sp. TFV-3 TaxID=1897059 RepID=UPI00135CB51D|nr:type II toxin-antitoxin system SpoIISB family antitoxin [Geobacillus sp. TFV-3]KAF0993974.1 hypothetical protein BJQ97_00616 [Geobacillus sp. TFV-3]